MNRIDELPPGVYRINTVLDGLDAPRWLNVPQDTHQRATLHYSPYDATCVHINPTFRQRSAAPTMKDVMRGIEDGDPKRGRKPLPPDLWPVMRTLVKSHLGHVYATERLVNRTLDVLDFTGPEGERPTTTQFTSEFARLLEHEARGVVHARLTELAGQADDWVST